MLGKKLFQEKRQEYEYQLWENLQHESATKLQASFRGYRDRRDVSMKQQEIIDNENYYKQILQQQSYSILSWISRPSSG